jgi:phospholipase/carboxylesterase
MHGLGASFTDFDPLIPWLGVEGVRFVFPQAPSLPVGINYGMAMPAWYDIRGPEQGEEREDPVGIERSRLAIQRLIDEQLQAGVPASSIVLAGFSQGGAMALYTALRCPQALAGVLVLSGYLLRPERMEADADDANKTTPILFCHGIQDEVVPLSRAEAACRLVEEGREVVFQRDVGGHGIAPPAIPTIGQWLRDRQIENGSHTS